MNLKYRCEPPRMMISPVSTAELEYFSDHADLAFGSGSEVLGAGGNP
jgi:hypothetical protein